MSKCAASLCMHRVARSWAYAIVHQEGDLACTAVAAQHVLCGLALLHRVADLLHLHARLGWYVTRLGIAAPAEHSEQSSAARQLGLIL